MRYQITVVGSNNRDHVLTTDRFPGSGETLTAAGYRVAFGGKGANQAVAAARLGARIAYIGAVGEDDTGSIQVENFRREHIDVSGVMVTPSPSGMAFITVDGEGNNTILVYPGANGDLTSPWISGHAETIRESRVLLLQLETPAEASLTAASIASAAGVTVIFDPAPVSAFPEELYRHVDIITPNEHEMALLTGTDDPVEGSRILLDRGVGAVLVTLGRDGCLYRDPAATWKLPRYEYGPAVDTTAAGDSFNGAFATLLSEGASVRDAAWFATIVASLAVTRPGAQPSLPLRGEVDPIFQRSPI